jgi:iron complex outermembrane receptor protein
VDYIKYKLFLLFILFSTNTVSLEVTIYPPIYQLLSKTISIPIPGSSSIIIDRKDLEKYENTPIHDILDLESGIKSRSIYGSNSSGSKSTLDIRGMGAQAKSNVLILINGQRLNNIDMSEIDFPSIPMESIDRIEIFKGNAASVLYGDGAIGGAINIITNPVFSEKAINEVIFKKGTFNSREIIWNTVRKLDKYSLSTYFNHSETSGYRDENEQQQNNLTSELRYPGKKGDHFFAISFNEQIMSTPGDRSQDQLFIDRRGSDTPNDYINSVGGSFLYGTDYKLSDYMTFILNGSFRLKDSFSDLQSTNYPSYSDTSLTNYQFTPRLNYLTNLFGKISKLTYGLDLQYADYKSYRKKNENAIPLHVYDAWQTTRSIYAQQSIYLTDTTTLGAGLRLQKNRIAIGDHLDTKAPDYAGWQTKHVTLSDQEMNYAVNIGLDHKVNGNTIIYGRLGNGFRYPNIDDRIGGSGGTSLELNTQTTKDFEIGLKFASDNFSSNVSSYIIEGKNELAYDTDAFENINMNATRRYGVELNTRNAISDKLKLTNNFTFAKAKYISGDQGTYATDFKGNDVPLVPQHSLDTSLEWKISEFAKIIPTIKYQDDMRMESDDENFQDTKIPSYIIANMSITSKFGKFFSTLSINNIFDAKYHNYAVASSSTLGAYNAYPETGREIILSLGTKF